MILNSTSSKQIIAALETVGCSITVTEHGSLHVICEGKEFQILWGNLASAPGEFIDFALCCQVLLHKALPEGVSNQWNRNNRFARIVEYRDMVCLVMDVMVFGGVRQLYLDTNMGLWKAMMDAFYKHLDNAGVFEEKGTLLRSVDQ